MEPFVDIPWLQAHRREVILADVRFYLDGRPGREAYERGHIPGAVYVELTEVLSEPEPDAGRGRHPLPSPERFAAGLGALGIGPDDAVIAYDDAGGVIAARLIWLLRALGRSAALLDGGLSAWPHPLEPGPGRRWSPRHHPPQRWPADRLAGIEEAAGAGASGAPEALIDARDPERFAGGPDPVDPRSGHIPGARNVPARGHLGPDGRLEPPERLREAFAAAGIGPDTPVVSYCGSGVTACFNLLALEQAGLRAGRLYPGSWSEWSRDPDRRIGTGR
jgi:thiosulfate/3-mercaptopyruvate sulfurtransferase